MLVQPERCDIELRIRDLKARMEHLRAFLMSSYQRSDNDASDPMVLEISEQFDTLLNEWMSLKRKADQGKC